MQLALDSQAYAPIHDDRPIRSAFVDVTLGREIVRPAHLSIAGGLTFTDAIGTITQLDDRLQRVTFGTSAFGVGPVFVVRCQPLAVGPFALGFDAVGSVIVYDRHFPAGGDVYNFSWRIGPSLRIRVSPSLDFVLGHRWMHVSNGQGLGPQNPSYEGRGPSVGTVVQL